MSAEKKRKGNQTIHKKNQPFFQNKTNQYTKSFSFINKIIYLPNFHEVVYVNFEQQEKPTYERIDIHQVLELYQAS
jgi:hypothetical protein